MKYFPTAAIMLVALTAFFFNCSEPVVEESTNSIRLGGACYIEVANSDTLESIFSGDFSLELWAMADASLPTSPRCLLMVGNDAGGDELAIYQGAEDSSLIVVYVDEQLFGSFKISGLDWRRSYFHYVCLTEADNVVSFYFDGIKISSRLIAGLNLAIGTSNLLIGADYDALNSNVGNYWRGNFDEVRLWTRCLDDSEVQFHFNNPDKLLELYVPADLATLAGLWRFNAVFSSSVNDESGWGQVTTLRGSTANITWSSAGAD